MDRSAIAGRIKTLRKQQMPRWTQGDLAEKSALHKNTVCNAESGDPRTTIETYEQIAGAFDIPVKDLLFGPGSAREDIPA